MVLLSINSIKWIEKIEAEYKEINKKSPSSISRWDPDGLLLCEDLIKLSNQATNKAFKYHYSHEAIEVKELISKQIELQFEYSTPINRNNIAVFSSATASLNTVLLWLKSNKKERGLCPRPIYYSIRKVAHVLGIEIELLDCFSKDNYLTSVTKLVDGIRLGKPDFVILTNPVYSVGLMLPPEYIKSIIQACNSVGALLIIDEAFRFSWGPSANYQKALYTDNMIVIRSVSKWLLANGLKFSHITAPIHIIDELELLFAASSGSLTYNQLEFATTIFSSDMDDDAHKIINAAIEYNKKKILSHYTQLCNEVNKETHAKIIHSSSGPCTLLELPLIPNNDKDVQHFLRSLLFNLGVIAIPSWPFSVTRENNPFSIRINLLQVGYQYIEIINNIIDIYHDITK